MIRKARAEWDTARLLKGGVQKGARLLPISLGRPLRDVQHRGNLTQLETTEKSELDDFGLTPIQLFEPRQRIVHGEEINARVGIHNGNIGFEQLSFAPVALLGASPSHVIDDDVPHGARGDSEKVLSIQRVWCRALRKFHVGLVHEYGCRQRLAGIEPRKLTPRQHAKIVIQKREEAIGGTGVAFSPCVE
jgi:hypothetical protein